MNTHSYDNNLLWIVKDGCPFLDPYMAEFEYRK